MRKWLYNLRTKRKMTQQEVAAELGMSIQQYNFIETGKRQVDLNLSTASKIAEFFNIALSTIKANEDEWLAKRDVN